MNGITAIHTAPMFRLFPKHTNASQINPAAPPTGHHAGKAKRNPHYPFTEAGIRKRAQKVYEKRMEEGLEGTPEGDWRQAIRELKWERSPLRKFYQWTGLGEKKGWDLVQLLTSISIPVAIFVGGSLFTYWNNQQQQRIADDKTRQETLNRYLDQMAESLKDDLLKAPVGSEKFIIAQALTITALLSLDKKRQNLVIQFLQSSGLNKASNNLKRDTKGRTQLDKNDQVLLYGAQMKKVNLANSDLSRAVLIGANLNGANLGCNPPDSKAPNQCSDLSLADLRGADLRGTNLSRANLIDANLMGADLRDANLWNADLSYTDLETANLGHANLKGADISHVNLMDANLANADLSNTNLTGTYLQSANLVGANLRGAVLVNIDLHNVQNLTQSQLEGQNAPFLCLVRLPSRLTVDPNRDCERIPR